MGRCFAGMVMDSCAAVRAKRICENLTAIGLSRKVFQAAGGYFKIFGVDAHGQPESAA